jgi:selenocysteine-specific elongation factor
MRPAILPGVSLLENDLAELVFDSPLWLADNDRLVLRDISALKRLPGRAW